MIGCCRSNLTHFERGERPFPERRIKQVLAALNGAEDGLSIPMMQQHVNLAKGQIEKTIKFLSVETPAPVVKQGSRWYTTPIEYEMDREAIERLCALRRDEQREMQDYMQTSECLMQFLARALDDPSAGPCSRCSNCAGEPLLLETIDADLANEAAMFLRRSHQSIKPRKLWPKNAFPEYGFSGRISPDLMAEEGRALSLWGDAGWGQLVHDGKYTDRKFSDDLVEGCAEMIETWKPEPKPQWVTCVPSLKSPDLVPNFAARLAARLGVPFVDCVKKIGDNQPQKEMQNSFLQGKNLDGVFEIEDDLIPDGPAFLIDDMVDSRWTFTVIAALLKDSGCPAVFPVALAMTSPRSG